MGEGNDSKNKKKVDRRKTYEDRYTIKTGKQTDGQDDRQIDRRTDG